MSKPLQRGITGWLALLALALTGAQAVLAQKVWHSPPTH